MQPYNTLCSTTPLIQQMAPRNSGPAQSCFSNEAIRSMVNFPPPL